MNINALEIVKQYLREHGFDGLAAEDCGCGLDDLAPCGAVCALSCRPARLQVLGEQVLGETEGIPIYVVAA